MLGTAVVGCNDPHESESTPEQPMAEKTQNQTQSNTGSSFLDQRRLRVDHDAKFRQKFEPDPALKGESGSGSTGKQKIYPAESFSFGKFQGQTIADEIETESDYVLWYFNEVYYQEDIYGKKTPKEWFGGSAHAENMKVRIAHIIELFKASDFTFSNSIRIELIKSPF